MSPRRIEIDTTELVRLYTVCGWGIKKIATRFGYASPTVRRWLLEAEVKLREQGRPRDPVPSAEALRQRKCRQRRKSPGN